jgi:plastocyanin
MNRNFWIWIGVGLLIVVLGLFLLNKLSNQKKNNNSTQASVNIQNSAFNPSTLTVNQGTTVTWTNKDDTEHTIEADDNSFISETLPKDAQFDFVFDVKGTFNYHCGNHPNEKGTIIVK